MKSTNSSYSVAESVDRIDEILAAKEASYEEVSSIPSRERLTFTNGFYVNCSAVFIDLRDSSGLTEKYTRPKIAKIYRSFLSESVAIINSDSKCVEVTIQGDAVWGVFDTPKKADIDQTFSTAARLGSLVRVLNCRYRLYKIDNIRAGIGCAWGRALMIKAGHKGSTINEVVWMGEVVNEASQLAKRAAKGLRSSLLVSGDFHGNLKQENKDLLRKIPGENVYEGDVVNTVMEDWWKENCG